VLKIAEPYLSDEHLTVDGTLIEAGASHKSFRPKDQEPRASVGQTEANFHGETRRTRCIVFFLIDPYLPSSHGL
jgi:hypothetical protein